MIDSRGRDTAVLEEIHIASKETKVLGEDPRADIVEIVMHPTEKTILAASFIYERKHWKPVEPAWEEAFSFLSRLIDGDFSVTSQTLDNRKWIVEYTMDNGPVRYYLYDTEEKEAQFLFTARPDMENLPLARMHPVIIPSRDGLNLVSYYTLPVWSDPDGNGSPEEPLPLVLVVHGGPWSRDFWGYHPWHQWLANRGYAVLSVNFRGSTGFGKKFLNAGNREWGGKMHDDLIDAVQWAIHQGIAEPSKIAIMGGSYGGYATLVGMTFTPEVFACGVDIVGVSNLVTFINSIPPYWKPLLDIIKTRVGDHTTEEGRKFLLSRSPITFVDRIQKPLLIAQGKNDPRVKETESQQIVDVMQKKGIGVTYVLYPDEGHGFARPENSISFTAITEIFLSRCLGGRYQPIGEDFQGSSLTVPAGAELIPGLNEALKEMNRNSSPKKEKS
ncbi:MAG: alpha/beta hydrolase family protein, partial [bacterium]